MSNVHESIVFHKHAKVVYFGNLMYLSTCITYLDRDLVKKNPILRCRDDERDEFVSNGNAPENAIIWEKCKTFVNTTVQ